MGPFTYIGGPKAPCDTRNGKDDKELVLDKRAGFYTIEMPKWLSANRKQAARRVRGLERRTIQYKLTVLVGVAGL